MSHLEVPPRDEDAHSKSRYTPCHASHLLLPEVASSSITALTVNVAAALNCSGKYAEAGHTWCVSRAPMTPEGLATCTLDGGELVQQECDLHFSACLSLYRHGKLDTIGVY